MSINLSTINYEYKTYTFVSSGATIGDDTTPATIQGIIEKYKDIEKTASKEYDELKKSLGNILGFSNLNLDSRKKDEPKSSVPSEILPSGRTWYSGSAISALYINVRAMPMAPVTSSLSASNKILASTLSGCSDLRKRWV